ncbi:phosphate--AMP phosphotransferase [Brotaphodocola sp.]|uniref:phosphate--AMP phosphotransferase n=1 Tax=Brotaphodocola sp. TaxID=3073577 RepID=UPI003D7D7E42
MLEKIDLYRSVEKAVYRQEHEEYQERLGAVQRRLKEAGIPVIILFEGLGAAGKGVQINRLIQALDPRGFDVYASSRPTEEEAMRPFLWRFWTRTPEKGRIAVFDRSWYRRVQIDRFDGITKKSELPEAYRDICSFEKQLTDDGAVIIKLFLLISQKEQKHRFKRLEDSEETSWRVTEGDWRRNREYDAYLKINEEMIEKTDTGYAPWNIIEATDKNYATLKIIRCVTETLEQALEAHGAHGDKNCVKAAPGDTSDTAEKEADEEKAETGFDQRYQNGVLSGVDLTKTLDRDTYKQKIDQLQKRLEILHSEIYRLRIPVVLGFEGWDAAGKGGAIRRLTSHLDPRGYQVCPTAAPNDIEKRHHYLWRFWNHMPKEGHIAVFDRTWYGRVMVERIEGFCTQEEWRRAYQEINEMEAHLVSSGAVVLKFWLHIDKDEQERRFRERMENPDKQWKITDEDWRNREKWDQYELAVNEMLVRTSTTYAPWIVVEGNSKYYARVKVLETVVEALERKIREVKEKKQ